MDAHREAKIRWRCRRGMLELDLLLNRFLDKALFQLNADEVGSFEKLLESPDPDIYYWLMGNQSPDDKELSRIVQLIRMHYPL